MPQNQQSSENSRYNLSEFLRSEVEPILQEWECQAREASPSARDLPGKELRDSLPFIFATIAEHAKEAQPSAPLPRVSQEAARSHAEHRWNWGFTLKEVTREYGILRTIIMERLSPRIAELTTEELVFLFGSLDGAVIASVGTYVSISHRKLEDEQERLQVTLKNIGDGIISTDAEGRISYLNPAAETISGWTIADAIGRPIQEVLLIFDEASRQPIKSRTQQTLESGNGAADHQAEIMLQQRDGRLIAAEELAAPLRDSDGRFFGVVTTIRDTSHIRALTAQLGYLATHDPLTGLPNRALLKDRLAQELAHAERNGDGIALVYLDLDLFKEVNDLLGHTAGDKLLKQVAERLRDCVRRSDTVCRVGGDEFIILLTEVEAMDYLSELGEKIASRLRAAFDIDGNTVEISTSIGISVFPQDGQDPDTLIRHADTAMYQAKSLGRDNVQFFAQEMNRRATERRELQGDLRNALGARQLSLHFQPQVELATGRILGAEVLLRWKHPRLGPMAPALFIPVAEESRDIMISIGDWVLEESCRQARAWLDAGYPPVRMSVNVSVMQLRSERLVQHVGQLLQRYRLPANQLQLELTESVLMSGVAGAAEQVRALEKMGVRIAVDDFGTGYSSLSYLKDLPVDELKIDQSFVHGISTDPDQAAIVIAVIRMGQSLNLRVIAEGVEDGGAVAFLYNNGCEGAQGYYYSKPVSPGQFEDQFLQ